jgi:hypothetical protein
VAPGRSLRSLAVLAGLACAIARGQDNPLDPPLAPRWAGSFTDGTVRVTLTPTPRGFTGTIAIGGQSYAAQGRSSFTDLAGSFRVGETDFDFRASSIDGVELVLASGSSLYRLARVRDGDPPVPPAGVDLSHLREGETFRFRTNSGLQVVYVITGIVGTTVRYTRQNWMDMGHGIQPVGDPAPSEFTHAAPVRPAPPATGAAVSREEVVIGGIELDCRVTMTDEERSWVAMQGEVPVFPGCIKRMRGDQTVLELVEVTGGPPPPHPGDGR